MKIFNWIVGSFCRTLGRFLFYIAIGLLVLFVLNGKVHAATYQIENVSTTLQLVPSNQYINIKWNTEYYNSVAYDSVWFFNPYVSIYENTENEYYPYLTPGQYLIEFIVYGVGDYVNFTCQNLSSNFQNINMTTGNWVSNEIESVCVDTYNGTYAGRSAAHVLYSFTYKGQDQINELRFNLSSNVGFFTGRADGLTYALSVSPIYDYDINIVNNFKSEKNESIQLNQNQTIINQNNQTNEKLDDLNNSLTSTEGADLGSLQNSAGWLPAGPVDSILNLPLSLLNNLTTNLSKSCQPVILPIPYVNKDLTLPCVNTLYDDMGISGWVTTIGVIASAFIMFSYLLKLYKWVDDTLSFRENNQIDNWGGI